MRPQKKRTVEVLAMVQACTVGLLLYLSNDREKLDLKLCMYTTPFGKSGHILYAYFLASSHSFIFIFFSKCTRRAVLLKPCTSTVSMARLLKQFQETRSMPGLKTAQYLLLARKLVLF